MTGSIPSDLTRSCCDGLLLRPIQRARSEEGKNYVLHFLEWPRLHPEPIRSGWKPATDETGESESHRGENAISGGSDPTFRRSIRPKVSWGRSRPSARWPRSILKHGATVMRNGDENCVELLTVHEVAGLLKVPVSWVYGHTRKRSLDRLPGYRLGKYWRFRADEVMAWVQRQRRDREAA